MKTLAKTEFDLWLLWKTLSDIPLNFGSVDTEVLEEKWADGYNPFDPYTSRKNAAGDSESSASLSLMTADWARRVIPVFPVELLSLVNRWH